MDFIATIKVRIAADHALEARDQFAFLAVRIERELAADAVELHIDLEEIAEGEIVECDHDFDSPENLDGGRCRHCLVRRG